nr:MAG TPA: hypothetical protein [Caudoviricetes sp.]
MYYLWYKEFVFTSTFHCLLIVYFLLIFSFKSFSLISIVFLNRIHLRIHFHTHICPYS